MGSFVFRILKQVHNSAYIISKCFSKHNKSNWYETSSINMCEILSLEHLPSTVKEFACVEIGPGGNFANALAITFRLILEFHLFFVLLASLITFIAIFKYISLLLTTQIIDWLTQFYCPETLGLKTSRTEFTFTEKLPCGSPRLDRLRACDPLVVFKVWSHTDSLWWCSPGTVPTGSIC